MRKNHGFPVYLRNNKKRLTFRENKKCITGLRKSARSNTHENRKKRKR